MEKYAVIMAGGSGTRLWPISRKKRPKQYISLDGKKSMLLQTIERLHGIIPPNRCHIVTNTEQHTMITNTLGSLISHSNILLEPLRKNTAACITYAALDIRNKYGEGVICCLPSDSYIKDEETYRYTLKTACEEAESRNCMVVIGIKPSFPSTGYGYIKTGTIDGSMQSDVFPVIQFLEKPSPEKAKEFVSSGEYLWNSGMLIGTIESILSNVKKHLPDTYDKLSKAVNLPDSDENFLALTKAFQEIESISFDYGVLEKSSDVRVVKGSFDWSDIGSLDALDAVFDADSNNNAVAGLYAGIDTKNSVIYSKDGIVAAIGLENMIIVNTYDIVLVCPRERAHEIRAMVELLERNGHEKFV
jgi:mannose-1-phosphate guanylyltransferase